MAAAVAQGSSGQRPCSSGEACLPSKFSPLGRMSESRVGPVNMRRGRSRETLVLSNIFPLLAHVGIAGGTCKHAQEGVFPVRTPWRVSASQVGPVSTRNKSQLPPTRVPELRPWSQVHV